jgi:cell division septation protein DedD
MKGRDMKYFADDDDDRRVRDYRRAKDAYDFSLEPRHMALLVVVGMILGVLLFSAGYITGKSQALKGIEVAKGPEGGSALTPTPSTGGEPGSDVGKPNVDFYDTLGGGEVTTEEMGSYTPPGTTGGTTKPPTDTATGPKPPGETKTVLYFIQMITTKDKKKADDLVKSLAADGYPAYTKDLGDGTTRVGIKWYKTKEEAEKVLKEITVKDKYKNYKPEISTGWP